MVMRDEAPSEPLWSSQARPQPVERAPALGCVMLMRRIVTGSLSERKGAHQPQGDVPVAEHKPSVLKTRDDLIAKRPAHKGRWLVFGRVREQREGELQRAGGRAAPVERRGAPVAQMWQGLDGGTANHVHLGASRTSADIAAL